MMSLAVLVHPLIIILSGVEMQKYLPTISISLLVVTLLLLAFSPTISPKLGIVSLLVSLSLSIHAIFQTHKGTENSRPKIAKDILILVATILLITFLGGLTGMLTNYYTSLRFGVVVGFVSAIAASFVVGYFVKKGVGKLSRQ